MSRPPTGSFLGRVAAGLVHWASGLVPRHARARWEREWRAELWHREQAISGSGRFAVTRRLLGPVIGAFVHAGWLRLQNPGFEPMFNDLAFAIRSYLRAPTFSLAAVVTLALGIAANVAVFTVVQGALLRPYGYEEADRVAIIVNRAADRPGAELPNAFPDLEDLRASGVFESVTGHDWDPFNLRLEDRTEWVGGGLVTASAFETLGIRPILGRTFVEGEDRPGVAPVVVLGESLWRSAFGAEDVVGQTVWLDGTAYEVIGVAPDAMDIPEGANLWVPLTLDGEQATRRSHWLGAYGRLAPGVTWEQVRVTLEGLGARLAAAYPDTNEGRSFEAIPIREYRTGNLRPAFLALLGAVGLLLLIVCANLTSLMLARSASRRGEFGVRQALGASRGRLARQLLTESLLLAAIGGALGLFLGMRAVSALSRLVPELPSWFDPVPSPAAVALALGLSFVSALIFGLAPVLAGAGGALEAAVRTGRSDSSRSRDVLVFAQVALSTVLLLAAGLLIRSLSEITAVDPGFETRARISGTLQLPAARYPKDGDVTRFVDGALATLLARPDIESVSAVTRMPFRSGVNSVMWWEDTQSGEAFRENPQAELNSVTPGYFATMGIDLRAGRTLTSSDGADAPGVVVISETFAREYFGSRDPIGRSISFSYRARFSEVVGVVADVKHRGLDQQAKFQIYAAFAQRPTRRLTVVARSRGAPAAIADGLRRTIRELDPDLALSQLRLVEDSVRESVWQLRLLTRLFWGFGLFAVLLAAVGIGGVVAQSVARRTREIGIRVALGAQAGQIVGLVGRRMGWVLLAGLVAGTVAALFAGRVAEGLLFGVNPRDPYTYAAVLAGFALVGTVAAWLPARRALSIDPAEALRSE